jgi:HK97 family phage portal protein
VSVLWARRQATEPMGSAEAVLAAARSARSGVLGGRGGAMRMGAAWACRRLRADLISTMPIDVYRTIADLGRVEVATPQVLVTPDGRIDVTEWMYATQQDVDGDGNTFGIITAKDGLGLPKEIHLQPNDQCTVVVKKGQLAGYKIANTFYPVDQVWHERQFTPSGSFMGLSPIANAAMTILGYVSAEQFARDWFSGAGIPAARLKNVARRITDDQATKVKNRFKDSVRNGDLFVHGSDWEYEVIAGKTSESEFLNQMNFSILDICRWLGVPGDMIDANTSTGNITYANVTQRNLQLLIMNLQPAITRRERALSRLTASPRFVKLNTDSLLRMDPSGRATMNQILLASKQRTVSEVRAKDDLPPYTPDQLAEIDAMFPVKVTLPTSTPGGSSNEPA